MVVELTLNVWSLLRVCLARYFELSGFTTRSAPPQARKYGNFIVGLSLWILSMAVNIALTHLTFIPPCQFSGSSTYFLTLKKKSHSISQANLGRVMEGKKCTPWSFHPCYYSYPLPPLLILSSLLPLSTSLNPFIPALTLASLCLLILPSQPLLLYCKKSKI